MSKFSITKLNLETSDGSLLDIKDLLMELNLFESLDSSSISAELTVSDTNNIIEQFNIFGQERIIIELGNDEDSLYNMEFFIFKISARMIYQKKQAYIIHCCSKEVLVNESKRISKRFKNLKSEEIVRIILGEYLQVSNKQLVYDESIYNINVLSPNWRAYKLISWLQLRTIPKAFKDSAGYFFYETLDNKFNFRSVDSLISQEPKYSVPFTYIQGNTRKSVLDDENFRIRNFSLPESFNILSGSRSGLYSHIKMDLDVNNRTFKISEVSMDDYFDKGKTLNQQKPYRSSGVFNLTENPTRVVFKPFLSDTWSDSDKTLNTDVINNNISKSIFRYNLFKINRLEIEIEGNMDLRVGDVIEVLIPSPRPTITQVEEDKRLSGKYIIHSIRHSLKLKVELHTYMTLVRDSFGGNSIPDKKVLDRPGYYR